MSRHTFLRRENNMTNAIQAVKHGASVRDAAQRFNIPKSTLHYRLTTPIRQRPGRKTAFTKAEEQTIVYFILRNATKGIPLTQRHLREAISVVLGNLGPARRLALPFKKDKSSEGYLRAFRRRHRKFIRFGKPLRQEAKRFRATNAEALITHFATIEKLVNELGIDSARLFNLDEVGVSPGKDADGKLACRRLMHKNGVQDFFSADFSYENRITMMPVISAEGDCGPPLFVVKGKPIPYREILRNGTVTPETPLSRLAHNAVLATREENGGVDCYNFLSWAWTFVDYTRNLRAGGRKILLVYDAYRSRISLEVLGVFKTHGIEIYALPAHTSGKTQPLDVVLFSVFKNSLNDSVTNCSGFAEERKLDLFDLCGILKQAYHSAFTRTNIAAGFRRAGLWPVDSSQLMSVDRLSDGTSNATFLNVEQLQRAYESKRLELRKKLLGADAKMLDCGYVDTTNGCVMTSATVLELIQKRQEELQYKKEKEKKEALERELRVSKRRAKVLRNAKRMQEGQNRRRAAMADMPLKRYLNGLRSLKERRTEAKIRKINRQSNM